MMPETLRGFEITSGGVCRVCGEDRFVLVAGFGACLTCVLDEIDDDTGGKQRQMPRLHSRRPSLFTPRGAPPQPSRQRVYR